MKLATLFLCATILVPATTLFSQPPQQDSKQGVDNARNILRGAYSDLQKSGSEWGGHRSKAMEHIKAAISELDQAEAWAKEHHDIK
jgi:hypothetical protein